MAGGAADCSQFIRNTAALTRIMETNIAMDVPVRMVARLLVQQMRSNRGADLSVGTMISGWDSERGFSSEWINIFLDFIIERL